MFKLYYAPGTCALASHIALEEAGASYAAERLDFKNSQQTTPQYLAINPKGRVPALVTDRGTLTETPAILAYIAQSFPQAKLMPDDPFAFAQAQSFNSYLCSTVHINHAHKMRGYRWAVEESSFADMKRKVPETMAASFALIERDMLKGPWVMGEQYTVCDPYLFTIAALARRRRRRSRDAAEGGGSPQADVGAAGGAEGAWSTTRRRIQLVGWAKRSVPTIVITLIDGWWARCALPTLRSSLLPALHLAADAEHDVAQPDRAGIHLGAGRVEHELLVDPGIERWRDRCQR